MRKRLILSLLAAAVAAPALAGTNYRYVHRPEADVYFGHVSWCELKNDADDPRVLRAEGPQRATLNLPLAPGDTLETGAGRRCEAQFDTGTLLRLDQQSRLLIETILAPSLTSRDKLTNLHLQAGRVSLMYRDYDAREVFQVLTPSAAVKLSRSAVVDIEVGPNGDTRIGVERGQASLLYGPSADKTRTRKLEGGARVTVTSADTLAEPVPAAERAGDAFQAWNREMNEKFVALHDGRSALPKPIERFPRSVVYFAQRYADPYGEWIWSELYGYAWRPYRNRDEGWRPFQMGRWVSMSGRQFWVPDEPWGWVPYHLGLWHWDKKHGWVWIPGSAFSPAWVAWGLCDETRYFRPLTLWDWSMRYAYGYRYRDASLFADDCGFFPYAPPTRTVVVQADIEASKPVKRKPLPGDEHGPKPRKVPELPLLPLPKELEVVAKKTEWLQQSEQPWVAEQLQVVQAPVAAPETEAPASLEVVSDVERAGGPAWFRDWNRDVKAARAAGGQIEYSSVTNLVRCDNCTRPLVNRDAWWLRQDGSGWNTPSANNGGSSGGSSASGSSSVAGSGAWGGAGSGGSSVSAAPGAAWGGGDRKQD